jgi:hypothetical protein
MGGNLIFLFISILVVLFIAYLFNTYLEPFVNPVVVSNLFVNPDEIFLVATNPGSSFNINNSSDSFDYNGTGVTYSDALKACQAVGPGVTLANLSAIATSPSKLSLNVAIDLSANWCAAGWVAESATTNLAYFPMTNFSSYKCKVGNSSKISLTATPDTGKFFLPSTIRSGTAYNYGVYNPGPNGKAFAICVGPKPPLPTAKINPFNNTSYSMYNAALMTYLETGVDLSNSYNNDIFPVSFTDAQVYSALKNATPPYNVANARSTLIANYTLDTNSATSNALNSELQSLEDPTSASNWNSNASSQSCNALSTIYSSMDSSLSSLKGIFSDLSGTVSSIVVAKQENGVLQTTIANICLGPQPTSTLVTAACGRLLSLDYDILYRNKSMDGYTQTNTITDLDSLNYALRIRECEIQQSLGSLQEILGTMNCTTTLNKLTTKYKNNIIVTDATNIDPTKHKHQPINCKTYFNSDGSFSQNQTQYSAPTSAFKIGRDIQYNPVDNLKISLQQISPFFSGNQYKSLLSDVLNQLSVTLRNVPQDYSNLQNTAKNTNTNVGLIENLFPLL